MWTTKEVKKPYLYTDEEEKQDAMYQMLMIGLACVIVGGFLIIAGMFLGRWTVFHDIVITG